MKKLLELKLMKALFDESVGVDILLVVLSGLLASMIIVTVGYVIAIQF